MNEYEHIITGCYSGSIHLWRICRDDDTAAPPPPQPPLFFFILCPTCPSPQCVPRPPHPPPPSLLLGLASGVFPVGSGLLTSGFLAPVGFGLDVTLVVFSISQVWAGWACCDLEVKQVLHLGMGQGQRPWIDDLQPKQCQLFIRKKCGSYDQAIMYFIICLFVRDNAAHINTYTIAKALKVSNLQPQSLVRPFYKR